MGYRYSLIVSQYYHSRHMFIVKIKEDFIEKAREFAIELMNYKRSGKTDKLYLGDIDPKYCNSTTDIKPRYNINDAGDIYFINYKYANRCMWEAFNYKEDSRRESAGFKKKIVTQAIKEHHDYTKVADILEKYFEIA